MRPWQKYTSNNQYNLIIMDTNNKKKKSHPAEDIKFPLPVYESADDIYRREKELSFDEFGNPDELAAGNGVGIPGSDLDIPGAESDDFNEAIGEEDEENNYYSLGGENHEDLEEDNPDIV